MERIWSMTVDAPWRGYPAAALALLGLALVVRGLWFGALGRPGLLRQGRDAYAWIRCFQYGIGGLTVLGLAAAWFWHLAWLAVIALVVLGEEMFETSRILTAINQRSHRTTTPATGRGA